jgi:hypothetical protein
MFLGIAGWSHPAPGRDVRLLFPIGAYFLATGLGTIFLSRIAAVLMAVPLSIAGITVVVMSFGQGSLAAFVMNLLVSGLIMNAPAVVVYRNWSCLR